MPSPSGISWLQALFYSCMCFLPQNGYNAAHAYDLYESPRTSHQHPSGLPLNTDFANKQEAGRQQNLVPFQREPIHYRELDEENAFTNTEDVVQKEPESGQQFPEVPPTPVRKYEFLGGNSHPFGNLLRQHTPDNMKGVSFPTMNHFKRFIDSLKVSFLTPGTDASKHFLTAREMMKNVAEESSLDDRSNFAQEGAEYDDLNPAEGGSEHGAKYYMPKELISLPNPVGATKSLTSLHDHDGAAPSLSSAPFPRHSAATGHGLSNLANGGHPNAKDYLFERAKNPFFQSTGNRQVGQSHIPFGSPYRKDSFHRGHVTASPIKPSYSQPQDFKYYLRDVSNRSPSNAKYAPTNSILDNQSPPVGFNLREDFRRMTPSDVPQQKPLPLNHWDKSLDTQSNLYLPNNVKNQRRPPPMAVRSYQPPKARELKDIGNTRTIYQPVDDSDASSIFERFTPQKSDLGFHTGEARRTQQQPNRSNLFNVRPRSSSRVSSRPSSYSRYQKANPSDTVLNARDRIGETPDLYTQNRASVIQTQTGNSRPTGMTSYSDAKRQYSLPQRGSGGQNDGHNRAKRFGIQQTFIQPPKVKTAPLSLKRQTRNPVYWPSELQPVPNGCVYWKNEDKTNGPAPTSSISSMNALVKSKNRSGRATAQGSKVCYTPHQHSQKQSSIDQWKRTLRQQHYKNQAY